MPIVRVEGFSISLDGYGAGPDQSLEDPLGAGGLGLHGWTFKTNTFQREHFGKTGETGPDDDIAARGKRNVGAWILGRNMFGPVRGPWPDNLWKGWWGPNPVYHMPVFVLTHHPRADEVMEGGTTLHFVTGGIHEALERARAAAGAMDVRIGGGVSTIRQYLMAGLIDEMQFSISPVTLGRGEHLLQGIDLNALGFRVTQHVATPYATHLVLSRRE